MKLYMLCTFYLWSFLRGLYKSGWRFFNTGSTVNVQSPSYVIKMNSWKCEEMLSIFSFLAGPAAGGCWARVVTVSPGPLIRVEGQPVSIRCDVTEYGGPREQVNGPIASSF